MKYLIILSLLVGILGCTEEHFIYDDPTDIATFSSETALLVAIQGADEEENIREVVIGSPVVCDEPRTYIVKAAEPQTDEDAIEGEEFEFVSGVVTIPAGQLTGSCAIQLNPKKLSDAYEISVGSGKEKIITLYLSATNAGHPVAGFGTQMTVRLRKTCAFDPEDFAGTYTIQTTLIPSSVPGQLTRLTDVVVEADPATEYGFIARRPYPTSEVDFHLKMVPTDEGIWEVRLDDVPLIGLINNEGVKGMGYGYGRGVYYPCEGMLLMTYYLHYEGSKDVLGTPGDMWIKQ